MGHERSKGARVGRREFVGVAVGRRRHHDPEAERRLRHARPTRPCAWACSAAAAAAAT